MKHYRISKYDPRKRGPEGTYLDLTDWVGPADIGRVIHGRKFTTEDFLDMEARYIRAVNSFFFAAQLPHVRVTNVFDVDKEWRREFRARWPELYDSRFDRFRPAEDQILKPEDIDLAVMVNLRNFQGCQLHVDEKFLVHFGWDFYVYAGLTADCAKAIERAHRDGLFIEQVRSPYAPPAGRSAPYRIEAFERRSGGIVEELTKELTGFTKHDLRPAFGFSDEHPLFGTFEIGPEIQPKLREVTGYDFDPEYYTYDLRRDPWM